MRKLFLAISITIIVSGVCAQQTQNEIISPAKPAEDSRPNNKDVPIAYATAGQFDRIIVVRLKHQTDILAGLDSIVNREKIRNGVILTGIGSVRNYHYHVVSSRTYPMHNIFVKDPEGPADLLNVNGYIIDSRVHAHITLSDAVKSFGGHLEPGTNVYTFVIITIGIFKGDIDLSRVDDMTYR